MINFIEICKHDSLTVFYRESLLEIDEDWAAKQNPVLSISMSVDNLFVGAGSVSFRFGIYILDYISIHKMFRLNGYGKLLLNEIVKKMKSKGVKELYLMAKVPDFFKAIGAYEIEKHPELLSECTGCGQFGTTCNPKILILEI